MFAAEDFQQGMVEQDGPGSQQIFSHFTTQGSYRPPVLWGSGWGQERNPEEVSFARHKQLRFSGNVHSQRKQITRHTHISLWFGAFIGIEAFFLGEIENRPGEVS